MPPDPLTPPTTPGRPPAVRASARWLGVARYSAAGVTVALGVLTVIAVAHGWPAAGPLGWVAVAGVFVTALLGLTHQRAQRD